MKAAWKGGLGLDGRSEGEEEAKDEEEKDEEEEEEK